MKENVIPKTICVFCASSEDLAPVYYEIAAGLGTAIGRQGMNLVHGGGMIGMMGRLSKAATANGARVTGIIPETLNRKGIVSETDTEIIVTPDMMHRKATMREIADAFVALPGGFGTFEELLEIITLKQLKYHEKPIVILNADNYYDLLLQQFEVAYSQHFANESYRKLYFVCTSVDEAITYILNYRHENIYDKYLKS
ncbi:MAG TPA: TIGR00730 family Rossman fold protein [Bacteroidales bacterium]|nr:TIGR00730 family Rossman fold protein [Bacteroidales bacterium]HQL70489.1 TIGR00730 family Rossman fold protein [Bacteroidales bacterium]